MSATLLILWFIGLSAATFVPPFWVSQSKRKSLREMLSSAYFGISVAIFLVAYTTHAISVGEVSFGKHQGHVYSLVTQPQLFFIMLALNLVLLLCGLAFCWAVFKKNLALYVGR
ncbi:hypothetical protein [Frateuria sp.]|uniref:hypothetical protein n=1 Tax=Frateuria sp. TaxID=2211372 RepID=UPI003F81F841